MKVKFGLASHRFLRGLAFMLVAATIGCGGSGGGSPTAPPPPPPPPPQIPAIHGSWSGTVNWGPLLSSVLTQMQLNQVGGTIGNSTVTIAGSTVNIEGTINTSGTFVWQTIYYPNGCGTLSGNMTVPASGMSMSGTITLDSLICSGHRFYTGPASLNKNASTSFFDIPTSAEGRELEAALRSLSGGD